MSLVADTSFARIGGAPSCRQPVTWNRSGAIFFALSVRRRRQSSLIRFRRHRQPPFIRWRVAVAEARATDTALRPRLVIRPSNVTSSSSAAAAGATTSWPNRRRCARAATAAPVPATRPASAGRPPEPIWTPSSAKSRSDCVPKFTNWSARLRWSRPPADGTPSYRRRLRWPVRWAWSPGSVGREAAVLRRGCRRRRSRRWAPTSIRPISTRSCDVEWSPVIFHTTPSPHRQVPASAAGRADCPTTSKRVAIRQRLRRLRSTSAKYLNPVATSLPHRVEKTET